MAAALNPSTLRWTDPTARTDGSAFGASQFRAYELGSSLAGDPAGLVTPLLALPTAFGVGQSPIPTAVSDRRNQIQWLHLRTIDSNGLMSAWTNGVEVLFSAAPLEPAGFSAA